MVGCEKHTQAVLPPRPSAAEVRHQQIQPFVDSVTRIQADIDSGATQDVIHGHIGDAQFSYEKWLASASKEDAARTYAKSLYASFDSFKASVDSVDSRLQFKREMKDWGGAKIGTDDKNSVDLTKALLDQAKGQLRKSRAEILADQ